MTETLAGQGEIDGTAYCVVWVGWVVAQAIGKLGHPLVREYLHYSTNLEYTVNPAPHPLSASREGESGLR
jgi:hypothetical protein